MKFLLLSLLVIAPPTFANGEDCTPRLQAERLSETDYACLREAYRQPRESWPAPQVDPDIAWQELGPLPERAPAPPDNPYSEAKAQLGEALFFDPKLSRSGQVACASCHEPDESFGDGRRVSFGHDRLAGRRNSPSLVMSGFVSPQFWDGRAASLEAQALHPVADPVEMAFSVEELLQRMNASPDYRQRFQAVFGTEQITADYLGQALATYQRTLVRGVRNSRFEGFLNGRHNLLSDQQLHGLHLYRTKARCMNCHSGPAMSDNQFHNVGFSYYGRKYQDLGRYEVTGKVGDVGAFRTPSLRRVTHTAPWMHNGLVVNLFGLLNLYNTGMPRPRPTPAQLNDPLFPSTSERLKPLGMNRPELMALEAFLETL